MAWVAAVLAFLGVAAFVAVLFAGALMTLLGLPGTIVIVLDALVYSAATGWRIPWWVLVILLGIALVAEVSDNLISAAGVKKYGGSTAGMIWAIIGGLAGAMAAGWVLGVLLPVAGAIVGPILGGLVGGFYGGYWYERHQGKPADEAAQAGKGAVFGRLAGALMKSVLAAVMIIIALLSAF